MNSQGVKFDVSAWWDKIFVGGVVGKKTNWGSVEGRRL